MVVVPSPCERVVSDVVFRARRSSSSSLRRSCSSPTSGATTSRIPRPSTRSSFGVNVAACSTSTRSASASVSAGVSVGRSSSARAITSACAVETSPAECAPASTDPPVGQRPRQRQVPTGRTAVDPDRALAPRRHVPITGLLGHLVGDRHQPQPGRRDPRLETGQLHQGGGLLGRREIQELDRFGLVQSSRDRLAALLDQVSARHLSPPLTSRRAPPWAGSAARSQSTRTPVRSQPFVPKSGRGSRARASGGLVAAARRSPAPREDEPVRRARLHVMGASGAGTATLARSAGLGARRLLAGQGSMATIPHN